jgi:hypothetical protein
MAPAVADVLAVAEDELWVYEIKSDSDSPARVAAQLSSYLISAHYVTFVVGEKMLPMLERKLAELDGHTGTIQTGFRSISDIEFETESIGIVVARAENPVTFEVLREPGRQEQCDVVLLHAMHVVELRRAARRIRPAGWLPCVKTDLLDFLNAHLNSSSIAEEVCAALRRRQMSVFRKSPESGKSATRLTREWKYEVEK